MKILKRVVVAFIICLALVGSYALLKKAPQLNLPAEDLDYLQEVGISASQSASGQGLSGAHGNVIGAPPLVATATQSSSQGSNTPPSSFGFSTPIADDSIAPAFNPTGNPSGNSTSEAPPFPATVQSVPLPTTMTASTEAPAFASITEVPPSISATPAATVASPFIPPLIQSLQSPQAAPLQPPPLPPPTIPPVTSAPPQSPPPEQPLAWDGPGTEVIFLPSSSLVDPWGVSGILATESVTEPSTGAKPAPAQSFSAAIPTSSLVDPFSTTATAPNPTADSVIAPIVPNSAPASVSALNETKVADSRFKRLPVVTETEEISAKKAANQVELEKRAVLFAASVPAVPQVHQLVEVDSTESDKRLYQKPSPVLPEEKSPPSHSNDYQQTSIRQDITFVPSPNLSSGMNIEKPMISFAPQKPATKELIPTLPTAIPAVPLVAPKKAESPEIEVLPFTENETVTKSNPSVTELNSETPSAIRESVERFVKAQAVLVESGDPVKIRNAFIQLSRLYEHHELNDAEKIFMKPLLDRLALSVIYARNVHILEAPYIIKLGDSVDSIAQSFEISSALLMKINGLTGARPLEPGMELKIVVGHFDANISVKRRELTLILGGLYAGRFPIALGERIENLRGEFYVNSKTDTWNEKSLTLNNGVMFYGIDDRLPTGDPQPTTVRFTRQDAKELFDILTERSVIIFED